MPRGRRDSRPRGLGRAPPLALLAMLALVAAPAAAEGASRVSGDFDGDGVEDLAIGVPREDGPLSFDGGAVHLIYGATGGLDSAGSQKWTQESSGILDTSEPGDQFGWSLAPGDFNGDDFDDLAIGVAFEGVGSASFAGAVQVIYGSAAGLGSAGNQLWTQDSAGIGDVAEDSDAFGFSLAAGDFDDDGADDLAVGASLEDLGADEDAGAVHALYGSGSGLSAAGSQKWTQDSPGIVDASEDGDELGSSLTTGDFDSDGFDDLAAGARSEALGAADFAGAVHAIYGAAATGLDSAGSQQWTQGSPGISEDPETGDFFGFSLAAADFDADGADDVAIGSPFETVGPPIAGSVHVIYGSDPGGLSSTDSQRWTQDSSGIVDSAEAPDSFGYALAAGDLDGDGSDDLAAGVRLEALGAIPDAGAVSVIYGSAGTGLSSAGDQLWTQDSAGITDAAEADDEFGGALTAGDFDDDAASSDDLAIGTRFEGIGGFSEAGAVHTIYGSAAGLSPAGNQRWTQNTFGIADAVETNDQLGASLPGSPTIN